MAALFVIAISLSAAPTAHADETYDFANYASLQNGYTVQGTITTDGTMGTLSEADITAFSFGIYDSSNTLVGRIEDNKSFLGDGGVVATQYGLELPATSDGSFFAVGIAD